MYSFLTKIKPSNTKVTIYTIYSKLLNLSPLIVSDYFRNCNYTTIVSFHTCFCVQVHLGFFTTMSKSNTLALKWFLINIVLIDACIWSSKQVQIQTVKLQYIPSTRPKQTFLVTARQRKYLKTKCNTTIDPKGNKIKQALKLYLKKKDNTVKHFILVSRFVYILFWFPLIASCCRKKLFIRVRN